ncbi:hypothetical protein [Paraburkholderia rhizosphaerae]|uniref:hypothetical protein n=1 Tax=Paraburkholderia rhizosphaerae TaxID=480658 RepID=UPI001065D5DE|nr:hypothetical protein [Paraburkholderia rhizosphaerae]
MNISDCVRLPKFDCKTHLIMPAVSDQRMPHDADAIMHNFGPDNRKGRDPCARRNIRKHGEIWVNDFDRKGKNPTSGRHRSRVACMDVDCNHRLSVARAA